ncbi:hypothetical protein [Novosphingobium sp.]|uniref:hypothetical protein n=1 Tax=Novosphingobium sp. TaxID=1874826 RepID=UPI00286A6D7C|nr:hypothetical protein [Novosphingobium sp.]
MVGAATLHPAARRKAVAMLPRQPAHEICLRPLGGGDARNVIATSSARDFVEALFEDLQAADWRTRLTAMRGLRKGSDNVLELSLPTHRRFQLALFEAYCLQPGEPRLDPAKIRGSGLVLRRLAGSRHEAWYKRGKTVLGWQAVNLPDADPDPAKAAIHPANAALRSAIAARQGGGVQAPAESVHGLYPAPPEVCKAIGKTVLFAVIPVASGELEDRPGDAINYAALPAADQHEMIAHLSCFLKARPERDLPRAGQVLSKDWNVLSPETTVADPQLALIATFLYQMMAELDALGSGPAAARLLQVLAEIQLPTAEDQLGRPTATLDAASFVRRAAPILIAGEGNPQGHAMPLRWPAVDEATGQRLIEAAFACLTEQHAARIGPPEKFRDEQARYCVRGFLRAAGHDDCPDALVWSIESEPFRILPWWDGEGPGTTIALPDIARLKEVKPSVTFALPSSLANLLKGNMEDLAKGKGGTGGPGIDWLCSFSIPGITLCAFIVLNIFLSMLNIIFSWMMSIKVCIPIPKRQ